MSGRYLVVGCGKQGKAMAYDVCRFRRPTRLTLVDRDGEAVEELAAFLRDRCAPPDLRTMVTGIDAPDRKELVELFADHDLALTATHYGLNELLSLLCIRARTHMIDLGGNTAMVWRQHELHQAAEEAGVTIVPDCGLMPGLGNQIAGHLVDGYDRCNSIEIRCGGLPQDPEPPLYYALVFSVEGLLNEYFGEAIELRGGEVVRVPTFADLEDVDAPQLPRPCEAFTTSGGSSTAPYTYEGRVSSWNYKTVRYRGHFEMMRAAKEYGLLGEDPIRVGQSDVVPREFFKRLLLPLITRPGARDLSILRVVGKGRRGDQWWETSYETVDYFDEKSGIASMERMTGYPAALVGYGILDGTVRHGGVLRVETAIPELSAFLGQLELRGIIFDVRERRLDVEGSAESEETLG